MRWIAWGKKLFLCLVALVLRALQRRPDGNSSKRECATSLFDSTWHYCPFRCLWCSVLQYTQSYTHTHKQTVGNWQGYASLCHVREPWAGSQQSVTYRASVILAEHYRVHWPAAQNTHTHTHSLHRPLVFRLLLTHTQWKSFARQSTCSKSICQVNITMNWNICIQI